jgi:RNA-directed DNA polymerase
MDRLAANHHQDPHLLDPLFGDGQDVLPEQDALRLVTRNHWYLSFQENVNGMIAPGVKRQTIRKRLSAKLKALKAELRHRWHTPVMELGRWLRSVVQGWFNYHAVPGNLDSLNAFRSQVLRLWFRALRRRGQRLTLVRRWLPSAKILHPHPNVRFDATHPR